MREIDRLVICIIWAVVAGVHLGVIGAIVGFLFILIGCDDKTQVGKWINQKVENFGF